MDHFNFRVYAICSFFSIVLMILFVFINYPYYKSISGGQTKITILKTLLLNATAILIAWGPVVYLWSDFSIKFLLPFACIIGAFGCIGSRFIYPEIVPDALAKKIIEYIEKQSVK